MQAPSTIGAAGHMVPENRKKQHVNRAGTRGFRPPEVLLKVSAQSPAIDVWAAGVILLSFLSGRFPFFASNDDTDALAELATTFGCQRMRRTAQKLGECARGAKRAIPMWRHPPVSFFPLLTHVTGCDTAGKDWQGVLGQQSSFADNAEPWKNLKRLCQRLRPGLQERCIPDDAYKLVRVAGRLLICPSLLTHAVLLSSSIPLPGLLVWPPRSSSDAITDASYADHSLGDSPSCTPSVVHCVSQLAGCLDLDPGQRFTADEALKHPFLAESS